MILQRIKAFEHPVMKKLLAKLIPELLDGVELWRIGWQFEQIDVLRCLERITAEPPCAIDHHDDALTRLACRDLVEKELHASGVDVQQYQTIELSGANIHCVKSIDVLMREHALAE